MLNNPYNDLTVKDTAYEYTSIPPPPPRKRVNLLTIIMLVVIVFMMICLTVIASLWYADNKMLARPATITATTTAIAPTNTPMSTPTNTPTPIVLIETPSAIQPTQVIVPYTASEIFNDFQASGIAMSNAHIDNSWCHACDYIPSGGAIAWQDFNNTPTANVEIATFATVHATIDDGNFLASQGFPSYYKGRCLLFFNASSLADMQSYFDVMRQYCN
jgi:hypothetical protein